MEIVFWLGVVPAVGLVAGIWVLLKVVRPDLPPEALGPVRRAVRDLAFPDLDATPEELGRKQQARAARYEQATHDRLVAAARNSGITRR